MDKTKNPSGYGFGTFAGVFTPSILTIIGVVMYLRFGWMLGHVGLTASLVIITLSTCITFLTGLSISALATNMRMKGGGAYYMLSRSFGIEAGAAIGLPLALSQAISVSFYVAGFAEALVHSNLPVVGGWDARFVGLATLSVLALVSTFSANIALKSQYLIMAAIAFSLVSFFMGHTPEVLAQPNPSDVPPVMGFWPVLAVFFPAVTGILSGVGMSGDLKNPRRSIPVGTIAAVLTGYVVYMAVPLVLNRMVSDPEILRSDTMILQKCARWQMPILLGVWSATLSSAVGGLLAAPRVMQALAQDRLLPKGFGRGFGASNDPRISALICFALAGVGLWFGDINAIAPILTMFNLTTYGLLNLSAGLEELMGNPSWRPTFRVKAFFSFAGFAGCVGMMFMISPGWTFIALFCESLIYWLVKRRALRARWGDMRTGLLMFGARMVLRQLANHPQDERNWRPNILVLTGAPSRRPHLVEMAAALSQNRSLTTFASIVPEELWSVERAQGIHSSIRSYLDKAGIEAQIRVQPGADHWSGARELVRAYGYGPLIPNTVLVGAPAQPDSLEPFGDFMRLIADWQRNVVIIHERETPASDPDEPATEPAPKVRKRADIWWRGQNANGGFMLALACLLQRSEEGRNTDLRLCHLIDQPERKEDARHMLDRFLATARVDADIEVFVSDGRPAVEQINEASSDADMAFIGLRRPLADETAIQYGQYFDVMRDGLQGIPLIVFAFAEEKVDFRRIFSE